MISERKIDSKIILLDIMNKNMKMLEELDNPKFDKFFITNETKIINLIDELIYQINKDRDINNIRSAFRKAILLNGLLREILFEK